MDIKRKEMEMKTDFKDDELAKEAHELYELLRLNDSANFKTQLNNRTSTSGNNDRLSIALKYFAEHRTDKVGNSGKSYDDCCVEMRRF